MGVPCELDNPIVAWTWIEQSRWPGTIVYCRQSKCKSIGGAWVNSARDRGQWPSWWPSRKYYVLLALLCASFSSRIINVCSYYRHWESEVPLTRSIAQWFSVNLTSIIRYTLCSKCQSKAWTLAGGAFLCALQRWARLTHVRNRGSESDMLHSCFAGMNLSNA